MICSIFFNNFFSFLNCSIFHDKMCFFCLRIFFFFFLRFALTYSIFFQHSLAHFETCSVFSFFLSLSCNRFISFLILSISFCISFCCRFGLFILCPYLYYTMPEKKILYTGEVNFFLNFFLLERNRTWMAAP